MEGELISRRVFLEWSLAWLGYMTCERLPACHPFIVEMSSPAIACIASLHAQFGACVANTRAPGSRAVYGSDRDTPITLSWFKQKCD